MMQRLIVTGCAGFTGWKVAEQLLANGDTVVGVDPFGRTSVDRTAKLNFQPRHPADVLATWADLVKQSVYYTGAPRHP